MLCLRVGQLLGSLPFRFKFLETCRLAVRHEALFSTGRTGTPLQILAAMANVPACPSILVWGVLVVYVDIVALPKKTSCKPPRLPKLIMPEPKWHKNMGNYLHASEDCSRGVLLLKRVRVSKASI